MKNLIAICISCFVFLTPVMAQMDISIAPQSSNLPAGINSKLVEVILPAFSKEQLAALDYNDTKNGHLPAIARNIPVNINLSNGGIWMILPNGDRIWRVQITGARALALAPMFDKLYLPKGSYMHVYMPDKQEIYGAFTNDNTPETRAFCAGLVHGETCVVEYFEPYGQRNKGVLSINNVAYAYRDINPLATSDMKSGSQSCQVNVACSEGDKWRNQIRSVVRIFIVDDDGSEGWCSGAMVNNVRKDCTPYVLSANHCAEHGVSAASYNQWVFYFNYQAAHCTDSVGPQSSTVNGCKKIADSQDDGGNSGSDFLLLQLNHAPPTAYNVYYSGWNISGSAPPSGVGIHHPSADIKKISTYSAPAISTAWAHIAQNTHWEVQWVATANGHGVTEPGSSGSPLYSNTDTLIVGHLTGGSSCCTLDGCGSPGGPNSYDLYGKLSYDWTSDGVTSNVQIKPWLDPDNTGTTVLHGMNTPCGNSLTNDGGIQAITEPEGNVCSSTIDPVIAMRNFGSNTLTSMTIKYRFDNSTLNTYNWTGTLFAGSTVSVTLPTATISSGAHTFMVVSSNPNNATDVNISNDTASSSFFVSNPGGSLNLALTTDDAGSKTTWQVTDAANNVVASGGPYPNLVGGTTYNIPFCLPVACYTFTIFSSAGNGMTTGENGNFTLTTDAGNTIYASMDNPSFGSQEVHTFCIVPTAITEVPVFPISIIPNPSTGQFNIAIDNGDVKSIHVFDITGKLILEKKTADPNIMLDLSTQSKGIYILQVETNYGKAVQKLVLK